MWNKCLQVRSRILWIMTLSGILVSWSVVWGQPVRTFTIGSGGLSWIEGGNSIDPVLLVGGNQVDTTNTPSNAIDFFNRPGWISPLFFTDDINIAPRVLLEGAKISAPNSLLRPRKLVNAQLVGTVNGDHEIAYERKPTITHPEANANGIVIILDFGSPVGVSRVRFYPRNTLVSSSSAPYQDSFMRAYEVLVNPYQTNTSLNAPDILVQREPENATAIVEVDVPPQYVRLLKIRSLTENPFEIDEIEVYGTGYLQSGSYYTDLIDFGDRATIGQARWVEEAIGRERFSQVRTRVRSGNDETPILYRRKGESESGEPFVIEVTPEDYYRLERFNQAELIDDMQHWSPWKSVENGGLVTAPGPRRYVQFRFEFEGDLFETRQIGQLTFDYLQPPIADTLRAEVFPRLAEAEHPATFRYAVLLRANDRIRGFDRLQVDTNIAIDRIRDVRIDSQSVAFSVEEVKGDGFIISFPLIIKDKTLLEFTFDLPIFRFGTTFSGRAFNSRFPTVPQILEAGNAVDFSSEDVAALSNLSVAIPRSQVGKLIGEIVFSSTILTPNEDGANDELEIFFNLLQLTRATPVILEIYDLAGRKVDTAFDEERFIGPALFTWDGRVDGKYLPPGHYIWVLRVKADAFEERHSGLLGLVY